MYDLIVVGDFFFVFLYKGWLYSNDSFRWTKCQSCKWFVCV